MQNDSKKPTSRSTGNGISENATGSRPQISRTDFREQKSRDHRRLIYICFFLLIAVGFSWLAFHDDGHDGITTRKYLCGASGCSYQKIELPRATTILPRGDHGMGGGFVGGGNWNRASRPTADRIIASRSEPRGGAGEVDLDRLARAVAIAETGGCTRGVALTHNNCHGLKENGEFIHFDSFAASSYSFKKNWIKHYGNRPPNLDDADKYTGKDRAVEWLANVRASY